MTDIISGQCVSLICCPQNVACNSHKNIEVSKVAKYGQPSLVGTRNGQSKNDSYLHH